MNLWLFKPRLKAFLNGFLIRFTVCGRSVPHCVVLPDQLSCCLFPAGVPFLHKDDYKDLTSAYSPTLSSWRSTRISSYIILQKTLILWDFSLLKTFSIIFWLSYGNLLNHIICRGCFQVKFLNHSVFLLMNGEVCSAGAMTRNAALCY